MHNFYSKTVHDDAQCIPGVAGTKCTHVEWEVLSAPP